MVVLVLAFIINFISATIGELFQSGAFTKVVISVIKATLFSLTLRLSTKYHSPFPFKSEATIFSTITTITTISTQAYSTSSIQLPVSSS